MPGLYEIALLCENVYKKQNLTSSWKQIDKQVGLKVILYGQTGYHGEAFLNERTQEVIVVHRGTELYGKQDKFLLDPDTDKPNVCTTYSNLISDAALALEFLPPELWPALDFGLKIKDKYREYRVIHTGHSLGGFNANIVGYICGTDVVAFDCPGCLEQLQELVNNKLDFVQLARHYNFLAESNLINNANTQVGNIYLRAPSNNDWQHIKDKGLIKGLAHTLSTHKFQTFLDCIPQAAPYPSQEIPAIFLTRVVYEQQSQQQQGTWGEDNKRCLLM